MCLGNVEVSWAPKSLIKDRRKKTAPNDTPHFISLAFLPCNQQQRRPSSFCHSGFSNRKCYATMGCVSVQVKLPVVVFHLSRPTTLQRFKKHDLPIRSFSAATPHEWEHGKCLPSNPTTKPLEITIHRFSQLLYVELLDCPWASLSKRRTLVHHQSLVFAFSGIIKTKVASSLKGTTSRDISSIEIRLLQCQCQKQNHAGLLAQWFCGFHVLFFGIADANAGSIS